MVQALNVDEEIYSECLAKIQQLEPSGVGARTIEECLIIQMRDNNINDEIIESIIQND